MNREIALVQEKKNPLKNLINLQSCKLLTELFNIEWDIYMKLINLAGCSELVHAEWILPDLTLSWITFPFRWLLSLSLSPPPYPFKSIHIHTQAPHPLLRQQVKQNNSLCHTIAPPPRSRHWLLYFMTFFPPFSSLLPPFPHWSRHRSCIFFFFFHTIVTLLKQEQGTLNCLTFLIVWSVSTWFGPTHQECVFFILDAFVGKESNVLRSPQAVALAPARVRVVHFSSDDATKKKQSFSLLSKSWHSINQAKRLSLRHNFTVQNVFYSFHKIHLESSILNKIKLKYLRDSV